MKFIKQGIHFFINGCFIERGSALEFIYLKGVIGFRFFQPEN